MKRVELPSGSYEYIDSPEEKLIKSKVKDKKAANDLTDTQVKDLVYIMAKKQGLIK